MPSAIPLPRTATPSTPSDWQTWSGALDSSLVIPRPCPSWPHAHNASSANITATLLAHRPRAQPIARAVLAIHKNSVFTGGRRWYPVPANASSRHGVNVCGHRADHDVALGIEDVRFGRRFEIGSEVEPFTAERDVATFRRGCPATLNIHTGQIDGGMIYGTDPAFLRDTLLVPNSCNLRAAVTGGAEFPPITTFADDQGRFFFLAGDIRISEHSFLFAQHTVSALTLLRVLSVLCAACCAHPAARVQVLQCTPVQVHLARGKLMRVRCVPCRVPRQLAHSVCSPAAAQLQLCSCNRNDITTTTQAHNCDVPGTSRLHHGYITVTQHPETSQQANGC